MEGVLDTRIADLGLSPRNEVTKDTSYDCSFHCYRYAVVKAGSLPKNIQVLEGQAGEATKYNLPWKWWTAGQREVNTTSVPLRVCVSCAPMQLSSLQTWRSCTSLIPTPRGC